MTSALNLILKSLCLTFLGGFLLIGVASVTSVVFTSDASAESRVVQVPALINPGRSYQSRPVIIDNSIAPTTMTPTKRPVVTPASATQTAKPATNTHAANKIKK